LNLTYDAAVSNFDFNFNLRRYTSGMVMPGSGPAMAGMGGLMGTMGPAAVMQLQGSQDMISQVGPGRHCSPRHRTHFES
jgi:hypothetical protein